MDGHGRSDLLYFNHASSHMICIGINQQTQFTNHHCRFQYVAPVQSDRIVSKLLNYCGRQVFCMLLLILLDIIGLSKEPAMQIITVETAIIQLNIERLSMIVQKCSF